MLKAIYDDRDPHNKGWFARDEQEREHVLTVTRKDAFRAAAAAARKAFGRRGERVAVYANISHSQPVGEF